MPYLAALSPSRIFLATLLPLIPCLPLGAISNPHPTPSSNIAHPPFAHHASDLTPDPSLVFGQLDNGFRYILRANPEPRERASLRLVVLAGSLHETDDQQGLAHYLEHLAFNGSTHYPPGTLIEFFQRMGMGFGNDTNAYTTFDHTTYMIELPNTQTDTLAEGLRVFADYSGGLLLLESEIERERGVILAEKRDRDTADYRALVANYRFLLGDTLLPRRLPIGTEDFIRTAQHPQFLDFYNTWYRPDRIALIAVGDFDPATLEPLVRNTFAPLSPRAPTRPHPDRGAIAPLPGLQVNHHHEVEASRTQIALSIIRPHSPEPDTANLRARDLTRDLAFAILNRRLATLARAEDAPFSSAYSGAGAYYDLYHHAILQLTAPPDRWSEALTVAENELRRALEHGFLASELQEASANLLNQLEQTVLTAPTRRSSQHASALVNTFVDHQAPTSPADNLAHALATLATLDPDTLHQTFLAAWQAPGLLLSVTGNLALPDSPETTLRAAYAAAAALPLDAPADHGPTTFAYTDFGPPGQLATRTTVNDLDLTLATFANGVRVNLKPTDFETGVIHLTARLGTGQLEEPATQPGLALLASQTFTAGGLLQHSADDIQRLLAGRNASLGFSVASDAFVFSGRTTPDDLLLQLQLLTAHLTAPGYRPEALRLARQNLDQLYTRLGNTPSGPLQIDIPKILANQDPRFGLPTRHDAFQRNLDEVRAWLAPHLASGALEIALVGDLAPEATLEALASTLGTLPPRDPKPALIEARTLTIPPPVEQTFTVTTDIPKAVLAFYWPTTDARDVSLARRLSLLGGVINDRLRTKVREEIGGAYSPGAGSQTSDTYHGHGFLIANITIDPERREEISAAVLEIAADLHAHGVTPDELERTRLPVLTSLRESARTNTYWLGSVLVSAQEQPERLDWARTRTADFEAITKEDLDTLARTYLAPTQAFRFTIQPAP